jgi:DNA gyrase/topoisomerase IV subunit B
LKGKLLNVRDAPTNQVLKNEEIQSLIKIIGLNPNTKYDKPEDMK